MPCSRGRGRFNPAPAPLGNRLLRHPLRRRTAPHLGPSEGVIVGPRRSLRCNEYGADGSIDKPHSSADDAPRWWVGTTYLRDWKRVCVFSRRVVVRRQNRKSKTLAEWGSSLASSVLRFPALRRLKRRRSVLVLISGTGYFPHRLEPPPGAVRGARDRSGAPELLCRLQSNLI